MRLVPLDATATLSTPCDPVRTGTLEILSGGAWAPVCAAAGPATPASVAAVACRSLGYPYSALINPGAAPAQPLADPYAAYEPAAFGADFGADGPAGVAAAKATVCSGTEASLAECVVLDAVAGMDLDDTGGYAEYGYESSQLYAEGPAGVALGPVGSGAACSRGGVGVLAVVCTMFPLDGAPLAYLQ